ncbi:uncharacterized protein LOC107030327 [Solanum pennellii]|uniref:Uncharacterized protein LOC107030327 n=1 Tax=Solanum pennellii TaxID=28526 RepID=A0ABM1V2A9_SOLPN|nr:uncharacterized protein LOC107030327 [Solanum pennellii]
MDLNKLDSKGKKGIIPKTWERCKSFGRKNSSENNQHALTTKRARKSKYRVSTQGCFSVYVGSYKQRFAIKIEYVNHPLFKMLLDEAESEFGYNSKGPLSPESRVDSNQISAIVDPLWKQRRSSFSPLLILCGSRGEVLPLLWKQKISVIVIAIVVETEDFCHCSSFVEEEEKK